MKEISKIEGWRRSPHKQKPRPHVENHNWERGQYQNNMAAATSQPNLSESNRWQGYA